MDPTWKPKQMVGTTLNMEVQETILKTHTHVYCHTHKWKNIKESLQQWK